MQDLVLGEEAARVQIDSYIAFDDGKTYDVEDFLIEPETGKVEYFILGTDADTLFSTDRRAVPAKDIDVKAGSLATNLSVAALDDMQPYDPDLFW